MNTGGTGFAAAVLTKLSAPKAPPQAVEMYCLVQDKLGDFIRENADGAVMAKPGEYAGKSVAICGAGPSLAKHAIEGVDHIWACNSALPYLVGKGVNVSFGVGIDQSPGLLREWSSAPDVPYLLASSVDPALVKHLRQNGRELLFFHNAVGVPDEMQLYKKLYPKPACLVGRGFMVTSRAIQLAQWMGFTRIDIYGCDCALDGDVTHANGETAEQAYGNPAISEGEIDGRTWRTRIDMLVGAVDLVRIVRQSQGRIRLIGDTLPVALLGKDDEYLDMVARTIKPGEPL